MAIMTRSEAAARRSAPPTTPPRPALDAVEPIENLTPREIVDQLDRHIVGQHDAKRAVAVALRNRYRRQLVPEALRGEIHPNNILMIGPTGVGKTEIARRVAKIVNAPFLKVEATRFTEVGYVGKDVESIVDDLVEVSVSNLYRRRIEAVHDEAVARARERLVGILTEQALLEKDAGRGRPEPETANEAEVRRLQQAEARRRQREWKRIERLLDADDLGTVEVDLDLEQADNPPPTLAPNGSADDDMREAIYEMLDDMFPAPRVRRRVPVREAKRILENEESSLLVDFDAVVQEAVQAVESGGVVFIDEIDKTIPTDDAAGADVSAAGVQRDLLPLIEGTVLGTRYGPVRTDHILFVASGAFHGVRPSDLIPELQGRFPVRVEMHSLTEDDLFGILTQPDHAITRQYEALLATEEVELAFDEDALRLIARLSSDINRRQDDIGARRLHTLLERVLEDILFDAAGQQAQSVRVTVELVNERVGDIADDEDVSLYIV
jgi:ATP-dependent HslUV protease ATP-binding subunit HslU